MGIAAAAPASDAELIDASRRGEHAAFGQLVERYQALVWAVSFTATGDRALSEDVAQETFLVAWRQLGELGETGKLRPWLCGIARNLGRMARRDGRREASAEDVEEVELAAGDASPLDALVEAEAQRIVRDTLSRVPERYREALVLYYQNDRSAREVAAALGISENAALQRLSRGRKYLADSVTDLVERSLSGSRPRRALPALVVAALPALPAAPRVATPSHGGSTMLKLSLAFTALAAAGGTTAYVVQRSGDTAPAAEALPADPPAASRPTLPPPSSARPWRQAPRLAEPAPPAPAGGVVIAESEPAIDAATIKRLALDRGPSRGPKDAPVTIIVFTDFQCGFCGTVLGTIDELWDDYPDQLRLVVKQFPVHTTAVLAAEAALAA
ncbi:MAG TPA: sigma-70 family RNA polymerase sigma factor, partial [Kofleriaceae bacterium]|nr:sigma-70 family RNA polymerase sigma factor [Kofleriaceae bacterium]